MTESALPTDPRTPLHLSNRGGSVVNIVKMPPETKVCTKCGETKPLDRFNRSRHGKYGKNSRCKDCLKTYNAAAYRDPTHPHHVSLVRSAKKSHSIQSTFGTNYYWKRRETRWKQRGIILADGSPFLRSDYLRLSELQGLSCALCNRKPPMWSPTLAVDHDAKTGLVRGLLCTECNHKAVGTFERHGHFTRRKEVNDLIRSYLENPPASRLPARAEAEPEPLPDTPVYSVITSPPKSAISWISAWTYTSTPVKETQA